MTDPRTEAADAALREALRRAHGRDVVPPFDEVWTAAEAQHRREARGAANDASTTAARRAPLLRWPVLAATAAATVLLGVFLGLPVEDEPAPGVSQLAQPMNEPGRKDRPQRVDAARDAPIGQAVIWYAPTDQLLQIPALRHAARPAVLTYYDPIELEVRE